MSEVGSSRGHTARIRRVTFAWLSSTNMEQSRLGVIQGHGGSWGRALSLSGRYRAILDEGGRRWGDGGRRGEMMGDDGR